MRGEKSGDSLEDTVAAVIYACAGKDERASRRLMQVIEDAALADSDIVLALLARRLLAGVTSKWANGWQPLDLVHVLLRRTSGAHRNVVVEALAIEFSNFQSGNPDNPKSTVDDRWLSQLERLGVTDERGRQIAKGSVLFARQPQHLFDFAKVIQTVEFTIELLAVLLVLPKLEKLLPPPGDRLTTSTAPRPAGFHEPGSRLDDKVLARVRGLLAKAESTTFPEEAEALTAKAQELMARHAIDLAMIDSSAPQIGGPTARRIHLDDPYTDAKSTLLGVVASENRCQAVFSSTLGFSTILGFEGDLDIVELLFTSLLTQATSSMVSAEKQSDSAGRSRTRSFRQSFLIAFAYRVGERLREATKTATEQAAAEMGNAFMPVLVDRQKQVTQLVEDIFPKVRTKRTSVSNSEGWEAGRAAANHASLQAPGVLPRKK